jgi:proteasome lid subunit RPN8/RPN11
MLVGAWHSHPGTPATPSARDRAEAWPDWCYLIVSTDAERARELRAWRLIDGRFVEDAVATWLE